MPHSDIELPLFQTINTKLGLKYLNGNRALYLKILNNFLSRYQDLNINSLEEEELQDVLHTLKGLSATLGMVSLSCVIEDIYIAFTEQKFLNFKVELKRVLCELKSSDLVPKSKQRKMVVLILNDNPEEIGELIEHLDDAYDLLVALNFEGAVEIINGENIDVILLSKALKEEGESTIYDFLEKSNKSEQIRVVLSVEELNRVL